MELENISLKDLNKELERREKAAKKGAFVASDLSVLAYANNFTLWHYVTKANAASIGRDGFFNNAVDMFRKNDMVIINTDTDGAQPITKICVISGNDGSSVTLSLIT